MKHPGLKKQYNSRVKQEYLDQDYIENLTEEEKDWLNKFNEEYYGAALDFKNLDNNYHNTAELKKDCTDRNNARNRCVYGIAKASGKILDSSVTIRHIENDTNYELEERNNKSDSKIEDYIIDVLDKNKINE